MALNTDCGLSLVMLTSMTAWTIFLSEASLRNRPALYLVEVVCQPLQLLLWCRIFPEAQASYAHKLTVIGEAGGMKSNYIQ